MNINVLVIDDEINVEDGARKKQYMTALESLNNLSSIHNFRFLFPESSIKTLDILSNMDIDFVFLDLVLIENWLKGMSFEKLLTKIGSKAPFAIVTSKFDVSNREQLSSAITQKGCTSFLKWSDLHNPDEVATFIYMMITETSPRIRALDTSLNLGSDKSVFILHLSDVQFGGFEADGMPVELQTIVRKVKTLCRGDDPTFVAITGDFAETGAPDEFDACFNWIKELLGRIGISSFPSPRILVTPGNHDVSLPLSSAGNLVYRNGQIEIVDDTSNPRLSQLGLHYYQDFFQKVSSSCQALDTASKEGLHLGWINEAYLHLGLVFYGLNTTTPLVPRKLPRRMVSNGELGDLATRLAAINNSFQDEGRTDELFVIGLSHHCLTGDVQDRSIENPEPMRRFMSDNDTHLFLHGHVHESDTEARSTHGINGFVRSCASTLSKPGKARPEDSARGFNLIELQRKGGVVTDIKIDLIEWRGARLEESRKQSHYLRGNSGFHRA